MCRRESNTRLSHFELKKKCGIWLRARKHGDGHNKVVVFFFFPDGNFKMKINASVWVNKKLASLQDQKTALKSKENRSMIMGYVNSLK